MPLFFIYFYSLQYKVIQSLIRSHSRISFGNSSLLSLSINKILHEAGPRFEPPGLPYSSPAQYHLCYAALCYIKYIQREDISWTCCEMPLIHSRISRVVSDTLTGYQKLEKTTTIFPPWQLQFLHFSNFWIISTLVSLFIGPWSSNLGLNKVTTR